MSELDVVWIAYEEYPREGIEVLGVFTKDTDAMLAGHGVSSSAIARVPLNERINSWNLGDHTVKLDPKTKEWVTT